MRAWRAGILPFPSRVILLCIRPNCLTSWVTGWTGGTAPRAPQRGHREDDRLDAVELLLVDLDVLQRGALKAGDHPEQRLQRPHLAHHLQLREEVLERELVAAQLALELLRLVLVDLRLGLLDERQDVAHAAHPLRHAMGVEALELVELLARRGEEDRLAVDRLDRQRCAAAGVTVELGHEHAVERDGVLMSK